MDKDRLKKRLHRSLRATFLGLGANTLLAAVKLVAGILGHSHALVADGIESMADIFSSLVVWRGVVVAAEPADADHPYGHGKAEPIAAATVALILLVAAGWIIVSAAQQIPQPHPSPAAFTLIVLIVVILVKESLFRFARHESHALDSSAVQSDAWHHRSDVISSAAAAIGITIALAGGKRFASADDIAAIAAGAVIAWNGWRILRPALNELMDRTPGGGMSHEIEKLGAGVPGVDLVEKCYVRKMGNQYYADMHVQVDPEMTVQHSHDIAHEVKNRIRERLPNVSDVLVHIEPSRKKENE
ncbi:MAG TPA: cation diffusion facilitator family transporter [Verrucomicrobiae bacterium]|nr:cation diffusion facilitator family transporter [Verrucomicrobiae bacterium]